MKKISILLILTISIHAYSVTTFRCSATQTTKYGEKYSYFINIIFATGLELNTATKTSKYLPLSIYAIIEWQNSDPSVIKTSLLSNIYSLRGISNEYFKRSIMFITNGYDQDDNYWFLSWSKFMLFPKQQNIFVANF